jgi:hypothetical protein
MLRFTQAVRELYSNFAVFFPEMPALDAAALHEVDLRLCRVAYVAGDPEAYEKAYRRLRASGLPIPSHLAILRWVVRRERLRRISVDLRARLKRLLSGSRPQG